MAIEIKEQDGWVGFSEDWKAVINAGYKFIGLQIHLGIVEVVMSRRGYIEVFRQIPIPLV